ncbi:MAG: ABC transporter permease [Acidimicrobiales bacterium]
MTAAIAPVTKVPLAGPTGLRVTQARVIRSEWLKFRTLRSSWIALGAGVAGMVGIGLLVSWATNNHWSQMSPIHRLIFDPVSHSLRGTLLAQLAIGVLGVLMVSGEYGTGMMRSTLGAVPNRLPVVWAKVSVFAVVTFVSTLVAAFAAFFGGQALLRTHGVSLSAPDALRCVIGAALYLTVVGVLAVGLGFMIRNTAGGIAALFGLLLVLPGLANALPTSWQHWIIPYLPSPAGMNVFAVLRAPSTLAAWTGFGVFCIWAAVAVALGALVLSRRDA